MGLATSPLASALGVGFGLPVVLVGVPIHVALVVAGRRSLGLTCWLRERAAQVPGPRAKLLAAAASHSSRPSMGMSLGCEGGPDTCRARYDSIWQRQREFVATRGRRHGASRRSATLR